ncbi:D-glycero-beta-D-manno-heptose 1,7-bisphosphate 7-phosphatase [Alcanivorax sp. S6407]|uniref:D-glycero-beta-D-manno-heptose 1,7-bisphosphate 7-phosphatase n=1 Tax=Alcanivorax sp. S6407 TaxID=2926424 RepID=UPI001FF1F763|nr:D-glycero-beta-D-manno-heptose 1,7-bisphosphate 7-phosphatase [Alcanivorax sp. S6407]MCK0154528.1 D-glycero-beta-D-manno-heptose 1,7-bisphosphate 7-phosphatase [Alcanivorax sp. S6407]
MNKLIILDRDGVINQDSDAYIKSVDEWIPIPGSIEAIARLSQAGYTVVVATNQSGIGRGYYDEATLDAMHERLRALVAEQGGKLGRIYHCPHSPDDGCDCRKPLPGLIDQIVTDYGDVSGATLIGDSLRDLEAGISRHCQPVLVLTGKGQKTLDKGLPDSLGDVAIFNSLADFVDHTVKD